MSDELPPGWVSANLGDLLVKIEGGGTPSKANPNYFRGSIPFMTVKDMKERFPDDTVDHISREAAEHSSTKLVPAGTLIVATRMALGRTARPKMRTAINQDLRALFPVPWLDVGYLEHWWRARAKEIQALGTGTTVQGIRLDDVRSLQIDVAPPAEQRRIVAKLEEVLGKVDASRARLAKIPALLKRFRQSVLAAACSGRLTTDWREDNPTAEPYPCETIEVDEELPANWRATNLGRLTTLVTSGSRGWAKYYAESGSTFIRAQNINSDYLDMDDIAYVRPPAGAEGLRTRVRQHDLLVTITGANVTKSALVEQPIEDAYISQHVALARLNDIRLSKFVFQSLICPSHGRKQLLAAAYGQGKPGLNLENIRDVIVHLPPMAEQQEIVRRVEVLFALADKIEARFKRAQARVEQLTTALLAQAFRGELVPQDPADEPASVLLERIRQERGGISPFDPLRAGDPALQPNHYPEPAPRELKVAEPRKRKRQ
jgi:type I restriction enzyme S subunit